MGMQRGIDRRSAAGREVNCEELVLKAVAAIRDRGEKPSHRKVAVETGLSKHSAARLMIDMEGRGLISLPRDGRRGVKKADRDLLECDTPEAEAAMSLRIKEAMERKAVLMESLRVYACPARIPTVADPTSPYDREYTRDRVFDLL